MTVTTPISIGSLYRRAMGGGTFEDIRVNDIHIDEDGVTNVQIIHGAESGAKTTLDAETFIQRVDTELRRINSDHDAWKWQQKTAQKL